MIDLDTLIKTRFKLFQGRRTSSEDEKIYAKVYEHCFGEIVRFAEENLEQTQSDELARKLDKLDENAPETVKRAAEILVTEIEKVPNFQFLLYHRLEYLVDKLLVQALRNSQNKGA